MRSVRKAHALKSIVSRSAKMRVRAFVAASCIWLLAACDQSSKPAPTSVVQPTRAQAILARAQIHARQVSTEEFHAANSGAWAGRIHNRFVAEFAARLVQEKPKDACKFLMKVLRDGNFLGADSVHLPRKALQVETERLASTRCARMREPGASMVSRAMPTRRLEDLGAYGGAIEAAMGTAANAGELATSVSGILSEAQSELNSTDYEGLAAMADVAVSSTEYWDANASSELSGFTGTYGDCIEGAQNSWEPCVWATGLPRQQPQAVYQFQLASNPTMLRSCSISPKQIAYADFTIGFAALIVSGGNPVVAVVAAAAGSAADALWQFGNFVWCIFHQ
jgi:hypothetical protein